MEDGESLKIDGRQVDNHACWLRSLGFKIENFIEGRWVKCRGDDEVKPSGSFAYKTFMNVLNAGGIGLVTLAEVHGKRYKYETLPNKECSSSSFFRLSSNSEIDRQNRANEELARHDEAARNAFGFWEHSLSAGTSDYLIKKGVGSYGVKFRSTHEYGNSAIVPMRDISGKIWSYQILNPNGSKIVASGGRVKGLFHCIAAPVNGKPIGISESYVTASTVYELINISMVCAFTCNNLESVALSLNVKYPDSPIIFFADNDRHHEKNIGLLKAQEACSAIKALTTIAIPDFGNFDPCKSATDWNDLVRIRGKEEAIKQLNRQLSRFLMP